MPSDVANRSEYKGMEEVTLATVAVQILGVGKRYVMKTTMKNHQRKGLLVIGVREFPNVHRSFDVMLM